MSEPLEELRKAFADAEGTMIDWRGNTFKVGDTVLYPRMSGQSCEIAEGVVIYIGKSRTPNYSGTYDVIVQLQPLRSSRFRSGGGKAVTIHKYESITAVSA